MTTSHVSTSTVEKPLPMALLTSSIDPNLNHKVRRRSVSCKASSFRRDIDRKKPTEARLDQHQGCQCHELVLTIHCLNDMGNQPASRPFKRTILSLSFHVTDHFKVGKRPSMPCFVPGRIKMCCKVVRLKDVFHISLCGKHSEMSNKSSLT